ncbi:hypothetical protein ZWY2020_025020 [Hordeum vulgare]|nr:hypothetical protein ZWY2020_025020 [Hordeum vulgare]
MEKKEATQAAGAKEEEAIGKSKEDKVKEKLDLLSGSVSRDREFDESLLLWHIATDLCCYPIEDTAPTKNTSDMEPIAKTLSEYMLYLLIKQPEMLSATAGIGLLRYRDTCAEAKRFFESAAAWDPKHEDARRMLLTVNTTEAVGGDGRQVVAGVWGEMLTYAAGKCRGSTHVRQLSCGGSSSPWSGSSWRTWD